MDTAQLLKMMNLVAGEYRSPALNGIDLNDFAKMLDGVTAGGWKDEAIKCETDKHKGHFEKGIEYLCVEDSGEDEIVVLDMNGEEVIVKKSDFSQGEHKWVVPLEG